MNSRRRIALPLLMLFLGAAATPHAWAAGAPIPPTMPTFDPTAIDASADPCEDFYQYACGGWHAENPMPADVSFWSRPYTQFSRRLEDYLRALIEDAAQDGSKRTADQQKVGDYYSACLDTDAIEARGLVPLQTELALIDGMGSIDQLPTLLGVLDRSLPYETDAVVGLNLYAGSDPVDGGQALRLWIDVSSLGLPGRDYYLDNGEKSEVLREQFQDHIAGMLRLLGEGESQAGDSAQAILALETTLAEAGLPYSTLRNDPSAYSNPMTLEELQSSTPNFRWDDLLRAYGLPIDPRVNVVQPAFLRVFDRLLSEVSLDTWKAYLRWKLVVRRAELLPAAFSEARFEFYGKALSGRETPPERSRLCINHLERDLPDALSRVFVARGSSSEMSEQTVLIFEEIKAVMHQRIEGAEWMASETKHAAIAKLATVRLSVGHPTEWLDDQRVVVRRDDAYGNVQRSSAALRRAKLAGLGQPQDINDWWQPATWVGGYQANNLNALVITAAYLLLTEEGASDPAVHYGLLGLSMAHELIHGFDPLGREYDAQGRLRDWWTDADATQFDQAGQCVTDHFSSLEYAPGIPVDGALVVSEEVTELAAASIAWQAYQLATAGQPQVKVGGLTPAQRYFLTGAQSWCTDATEETWRSLSKGDGHAWGTPAVNGIVPNLPEFAEAFGCQAGDAMVKPAEEICKIW